MYFDRFDICLAYYHYSIGYGGSSPRCYYANQVAMRLSALPYKPGHSEEYFSGLLANENAREIYEALVRREGRTGYIDCACRDCFNGPIIGVADVTLCDACADAGCEYGEHECQREEPCDEDDEPDDEPDDEAMTVAHDCRDPESGDGQ